MDQEARQNERLIELEERVLLLELRLGAGAAESTRAAPPSGPPDSPAPTSGDAMQTPPPLHAQGMSETPGWKPFASFNATCPVASDESARKREVLKDVVSGPAPESRGTLSLESRATPRPTPKTRVVRVPSPGINWGEVERQIGQRWAAWAGALTFVIGVGLLFTVAWRRGWFQAIPPSAKCMIGVLLGLAMLVGAEFVRKKLGALAAIGLNAAGLGVVYVSTYSAFSMFHLLSAPVAFALLSSVAILGIFIAARAGLASVGVVALIGGYLTPFLVDSENPSPWVLPIHLTVLLGLAVGLTAWRGPPFFAVRVTAQIGTLGIGAVWALATRGVPLPPVLFLLASSWCLLHAEAIRAVTRWGADSTTSIAGAFFARSAIVASVTASGWVLSVGVLVLGERAHADPFDWVVPLALALASGILAWVHAPRVRTLLGHPSSLVEALACVLAWKSLALAPVAIALALSDWLRLAAWGSMAIAAAIAARRTAIWTLALYAFLLLVVTTTQLVAIDSWHSDVLRVGRLEFGIYFSRWMASAAILCAAWLGVARILGLPVPGDPGLAPAWRIGLARASGIIGVVLALALWIHAKNETRTLVFVLPFVAAAFLMARAWWPGLWVDRTAAAGTLFAAACWLGEFVPAPWLADPSPLFQHPGLLSSIVIASAVLLAGRLTDHPTDSPTLRSVLWALAWWVAGGLLFLSSSYEIARIAQAAFTDETARSACISVWWGALAVGLIVLGFAILRPWPRRIGLALLGLALCKVVLYDLATVSLEWRAATFLVLGLVMLGIGLVYTKVSARLEPRAAQTDPN